MLDIAESASTVFVQLPPQKGYPEAISEPSEVNSLVSYFRPSIDAGRIDRHMLIGALYNPLNIEYVANKAGLPCPPGYSEREMEARLNETVACPGCGHPTRRFGNEYVRWQRCNWDCDGFW